MPLTALEITKKYFSFFEKRGHKRIANFPLVPENDPTTLFTSSGMQPLLSYLLGEPHPQGKRLVNVQNCFRAQDIEEVGDNRHTTFFRMVGNWSLGDYFKVEQLSWFFEFLTSKDEGLGLDPNCLYVTIFKGENKIPKDQESEKIWQELFQKAGLSPSEHIFSYGFEKNWWSRSGLPQDMPSGEPGGPDSEVFYKFTEIKHDKKFGEKCHPNCDCGKFLEIGNSVFMEYQKQGDGFVTLPQKNVDFGGGLERLLAAVLDQPDIFQTSLFAPIIRIIEKTTGRSYQEWAKNMRILIDHLTAAVFIINSGIIPSNKEQGYLLRRLIRRALDNYQKLEGKEISPILEAIVNQNQATDPTLASSFEKIKLILLEEETIYRQTLMRAKSFLKQRYKLGDELKGVVKISAEDAFKLYTSHGLSPSQIKSLGFIFNDAEFAQKMKKHQGISRKGRAQKFTGGLVDQSKKTIAGHTATHLLNQALRDVLGSHVYQAGSNITSQRLRFDFSHEKKLTPEQLQKVEEIVNRKIKENLPVSFKIMTIQEAKNIGAIGVFPEKYQGKVKVYSVGDYSKEICGGPHVNFTKELGSFKIKKEESIGLKIRRIYAVLQPS